MLRRCRSTEGESKFTWLSSVTHRSLCHALTHSAGISPSSASNSSFCFDSAFKLLHCVVWCGVAIWKPKCALVAKSRYRKLLLWTGFIPIQRFIAVSFILVKNVWNFHYFWNFPFKTLISRLQIRVRWKKTIFFFRINKRKKIARTFNKKPKMIEIINLTFYLCRNETRNPSNEWHFNAKKATHIWVAK